jgi:hypothetical protein
MPLKTAGRGAATGERGVLHSGALGADPQRPRPPCLMSPASNFRGIT